jgi:IS30 family transposase
MEIKTRHYRHLSAEQRAMIAIGMKQGQSMRAIARWVGCSASTVSRELRRHGGAEGYDATAAGLGYRERRRRSVRRRKLVEGSSLWRAVDHRLRFLHWSPEQIAATLRAMHPGDPAWSISHETIYAVIDAHRRGSLLEGLIEVLAQRKPQRGHRRRSATAGGP